MYQIARTECVLGKAAVGARGYNRWAVLAIVCRHVRCCFGPVLLCC